jgi:hypothetical protein
VEEGREREIEKDTKTQKWHAERERDGEKVKGRIGDRKRHINTKIARSKRKR